MNFPKDKYYYLDGKKPVATDDLIKWAKRFNEPRHIGNTFLFGKRGPHISTVFLGINHQWGGGPPLLFETMIFGGYHDQWMDRYATWEEAKKGHRRAVWKAIQTLPLGLLKQKAYLLIIVLFLFVACSVQKRIIPSPHKYWGQPGFKKPQKQLKNEKTSINYYRNYNHTDG